MKKFIYILLPILLFSFGCEKDEDSTIPLVNVDIYIYSTNPEFIDLNAVGGWTYVTGGSRGIIVYRISNSEFKAFDRHCTYDASSSCALVSVDGTNITAFDDCCGSKFILTTGAVSQSPATVPLKQYNTSFDGSVLHIFN